MNKMTQAVLAAAVLGACSTAVFADGEDAARGGNDGPDYSRCTELGCQKDIPITLEVPKKCTVTGGSPIVLSSSGGAKTSNYSIQSNTHYVLELTTANAGTSNSTFVKNTTDPTAKVTTTILTNGGSVGWGNSNHAGMGTDNYTVSVNNAATTAANKAGTYTDTYRIRVSY
ncbi:hypothetical protein [Acinetobacter sp. ANC 4648]|uniref:hypothetical protein n=1 Tax=Acinetobacter sp. ANC 4648 TaxID=1977875 RepID=UPI000A351268|nr:hypothetical protein [Acinetobacter sp. ANC 4648]OTG84762.1 hypothetical protein B9T27_00635 [Acinetobacter sp. ANC 4648]